MRALAAACPEKLARGVRVLEEGLQTRWLGGYLLLGLAYPGVRTLGKIQDPAVVDLAF